MIDASREYLHITDIEYRIGIDKELSIGSPQIREKLFRRIAWSRCTIFSDYTIMCGVRFHFFCTFWIILSRSPEHYSFGNICSIFPTFCRISLAFIGIDLEHRLLRYRDHRCRDKCWERDDELYHPPCERYEDHPECQLRKHRLVSIVLRVEYRRKRYDDEEDRIDDIRDIEYHDPETMEYGSYAEEISTRPVRRYEPTREHDRGSHDDREHAQYDIQSRNESVIHFSDFRIFSSGSLCW